MQIRYKCQICGKFLTIREYVTDSCGYIQCSYEECANDCKICDHINTCEIAKGIDPILGENIGD